MHFTALYPRKVKVQPTFSFFLNPSADYLNIYTEFIAAKDFRYTDIEWNWLFFSWNLCFKAQKKENGWNFHPPILGCAEWSTNCTQIGTPVLPCHSHRTDIFGVTHSPHIHTCIWTVAGSRRIHREPTQIHQEHATHSTQNHRPSCCDNSMSACASSIRKKKSQTHFHWGSERSTERWRTKYVKLWRLRLSGLNFPSAVWKRWKRFYHSLQQQQLTSAVVIFIGD